MTLDEVFAHLGCDDPLRGQAFQHLYWEAHEAMTMICHDVELAQEALHDVMASWLRRHTPIVADDPHAYLATALRNRCYKLIEHRSQCPSFTGLCALPVKARGEQPLQAIDILPCDGLSGAWLVDFQDGFQALGPIFERGDDFPTRMEGVRRWLMLALPPMIARRDKRENTLAAIDMLFDIYLDVHSQRSLAKIEAPSSDPGDPAFERALIRVQKRLSRARLSVLEILEDAQARSALGLGSGDSAFLRSLFGQELRDRQPAIA